MQYDPYSRKSLLDHFYDDDVSPEALARGEAMERGDFLTPAVRGQDPPQPAPHPGADGPPGQRLGHPAQDHQGRHARRRLAGRSKSPTCSKACRATARCTSRSSSTSRACRPAPTTATSTLATIRSAASASSARGSIETELDEIGLVDEWLGLDVNLSCSAGPRTSGHIPIETVSQSEGGFELVHQSVVVQPHWHIQGDAEGRWSVTMRLLCDTALAESRMPTEHREALLT